MNTNSHQTLGEFIIENQADFIYSSGELSRLLSSIKLATKVFNYKVNKAGLVNILGEFGNENVQGEKQQKLDLSNEDLFSNSLAITKKRSINSSEIAPKLPELEEELKSIFERLEHLSSLTESSFADMIQAQRTKQLKGFEKIKQRLVHAEVKKNEDLLKRIEQLLNDLSQQNGLQERVKNFADFDYINIQYFIDFIEDSLRPFDFEFIINTLKEEL